MRPTVRPQYAVISSVSSSKRRPALSNPRSDLNGTNTLTRAQVATTVIAKPAVNVRRNGRPAMA